MLLFNLYICILGELIQDHGTRDLLSRLTYIRILEQLKGKRNRNFIPNLEKLNSGIRNIQFLE